MKIVKESGFFMSYDLDRFLKAQNQNYEGYETALSEIKSGFKRSHWIWYIFPQLKGLGRSGIAEQYGLDGILEAKAYLANETLCNRLVTITLALLADNKSIVEILGHTDAMKVRSCMTLFEIASGDLDTPFRAVLDKFYNGKQDDLTLEIINKSSSEE